MAEQLELIIANLLVPDSNVIAQATLQLKELMKNAEAVPVLCQLFSSSKTEVRQYAAVLLRKKVTKKKQWNDVALEIRENIKGNIFEILIREPDQKVRKSLVQLIATICKHELPEGKWQKVFDVFGALAGNEDFGLRETGMFLMSSIASVAHEELKPHLQGYISICGASLAESRNHMVQYHSLRALTHILPSMSSPLSNQFQALIPKSFEAITNVATADEDLATETLELFEGLVNCEFPILTPHLRTAITYFVEISKNQNVKPSLRIAALSVLCEMIEKMKKAVLKMNIMPALISELFSILCEEEEDEEDEDENTVSSMASQVFSLMALYLPPEKFIPPLMKLIEPAFENPDPKVRAGAFIAVAVSTEGCSENIKHKHMKKLLKCIYKGMSDENDRVRSSSMFALAEFSEYLQPDINKFSQELLPLLFDCLSKIATDESAERRDLARIYYAIEKFCENLGKDIVQYLPQLMEFLITSAKNSTSYDVKELSISTIGAAAESADEALMPYLPHILELIKGYLQPTSEEGPLKVQVQSLNTLSTLLRKSEQDQELVSSSFTMALNLIGDAIDPELRGAIYRVFGTCWTILKDKLDSHVAVVSKMMIDCMKSNEGISATFHDDDAKHVSEIFDDDEDDEDIEGDEGDDSLLGENVSISLQNSYMNEKMDALIALGEIASGSGIIFLPYFEESFKECLDLLVYPDSSIVSSAASCATDLCCAAHTLIKTNPELEGSISSGLNMMLESTVPKLLAVVRDDVEREVVISVVEYLNKLISTIGLPVLHAAKSPNVFFDLVKDVIKRKLKCQGEEVDEDDEDEAEYDTLLIESAGDLMPTLASIAPGNDFVAFYNGMIPDLLKKLKPNSTTADRAFALGNIAETLFKLGRPGGVFAMKMYPVMMSGVKHEDEEVRNNAIYGLGVLAEFGGSPILNHYTEMLKTLSDALAKEEDRRVIDNICGAVCRMISSNPAAVPVGQVLPTIMNYLPLQCDLEENPTVFQCLASLYSQKNPDVFQVLPQILNFTASLLNTKLKTEFKSKLVAFVQEVSRNTPEAFASITDEQTIQVLQCCMQNGIN